MISSLIGIVGSVMIGCTDEGGGAKIDRDLALGASGAESGP